MDEDVVDGVEVKKWSIFSKKIPQSKVVYFSQIIIIYVVAIASIINLTIQEENQTLWSSLLSACIGYVLPAPQFNENENDDNENEQ